ncbi:hypothetical protein BDR26DRAFT_898210 [Obelidium mucronatum]|nr:hypothetical protein BDR26DRAFT_898210 [Obelidium mucronatum]
MRISMNCLAVAITAFASITLAIAIPAATTQALELDANTGNGTTSALLADRDGGVQKTPKYFAYEGFDWWGWDAGSDYASNYAACGYKTYKAGHRIFTWHSKTGKCFFKGPAYADVQMRITNSDLTYEADFTGSFDVGQIHGVPESTCKDYCKPEGVPDRNLPPCLVSVYAGESCYLKYPNRSGPSVWAGVVTEFQERQPRPCKCGIRRCCGNDPIIVECCDW